MVKEGGRYGEKAVTFPEAMLACGKRQAQLIPFSSCPELNNFEEDMKDLRFPENQYYMFGNFKRAADSKSRDECHPVLSLT